MWERIFADLVADKKNLYLMLDSTIVQVHQQAAAARKKRGCEDKAMGRSRGGLSTKIHLLSDENGLPVAFRITPGQAAKYAEAIRLLEGQQADAVIADKGYDSAEIVAKIQSLGAVAVIPPRRHWKQPRTYDRELYKQRNRIETLLQPPQTLPPLQHTILQNPSKPSVPLLLSHAHDSDFS